MPAAIPTADDARVEAPERVSPDRAALNGGAAMVEVKPTAAVLGTSGRSWSLAGLWTNLDNYIANAATDISLEERRLILRDPQVSSQLVIRRNAVLIDGIQIMPSADESDATAYAIAKENADFCKYIFENLPGGLFQRLLELEQRDVLCNTAADVRWVEKDYGQKYKGKLVIKSMPVFAPTAYTPWEDAGEIIGLQPNDSPKLADGKPRVYGMDKFAFLSFRPEAGRPYGTDLIPAIYMPWKKKVEGHPLEMMYMDLFSNPSLAGFAPEDATQGVKVPTGRVIDGVPEYVLDGSGNPITISPQEAMQMGLQNFAGSGSSMTFPPKSKLQMIEAQGDGRIFTGFFDKENWEIMVAINGTGNMTGRAKYGSNATAQTGEEAVYLTGWGERYQVAAMIKSICERAIKWNFPERNRDFIPIVTCGDPASEGLWALLRAIAANMAGAELLIPEICRRVGFKAPEMAELKEAAKATLPGTVRGSTPNGQGGGSNGGNE